MIWLYAVSVLAIVAASASIWGTIDDRRDIATGRPSFETLASFTGVWRREVFTNLLGEPDTMGRFALSPDQIGELPISMWTRFFDNAITDIASIILSGSAPILWSYNSTIAIGSLALGAGIQLTGYSIAAILTYRSGMWREWLAHEQTRGTGNEHMKD